MSYKYANHPLLWCFRILLQDFIEWNLTALKRFGLNSFVLLRGFQQDSAEGIQESTNL